MRFADLQTRYFISLINDSAEYNDDLNCLLAGIWRMSSDKQLNAKKVEINPNPNNGNFEIKFEKVLHEKIDLVICDIHGREVYRLSNMLNRDRIVMDLSKLSSGCYSIRISDEDELLFNDKLMIVK